MFRRPFTRRDDVRHIGYLGESLEVVGVDDGFVVEEGWEGGVVGAGDFGVPWGVGRGCSGVTRNGELSSNIDDRVKV